VDHFRGQTPSSNGGGDRRFPQRALDSLSLHRTEPPLDLSEVSFPSFSVSSRKLGLGGRDLVQGFLFFRIARGSKIPSQQLGTTIAATARINRNHELKMALSC
jgi:hypothetical protein